jgi:hypothetical protein
MRSKFSNNVNVDGPIVGSQICSAQQPDDERVSDDHHGARGHAVQQGRLRSQSAAKLLGLIQLTAVRRR